MRILAVAAIVWFAVGAPASAQTGDTELMAPIQKFIDSFNKGDAAAAAATHAAGADLVIIDEVPLIYGEGQRPFSPGAPIWRAMPRRTASPNRWSRSARRPGPRETPIKPTSWCPLSTRLSKVVRQCARRHK